MMEDLRSGNLNLDCEIDCLWSHLGSRRAQHQLYLNGQYESLAVSVMQIGMNRDLSYYYLGVCAENLGYLDAAEKYFKQSYHLFQNGRPHNRCKEESICNGIKLDVELPEHISSLKRAKQKLAVAAEAARISEAEFALQERSRKTVKNSRGKKKNKEILKAQQILLDAGYDVGEADGRANEKYQKALKRYQADNGLVPTGQLNTATRSSLGMGNPNPQKEAKKSTVEVAEKTDSPPMPKDNLPAASPTVPETPQPEETDKSAKKIEIAAIPLKVSSSSDSLSKKSIIAETTTIMVEPNVMSTSMGEVPSGTAVEVLEENSSFLKIRYGDKEGFVHSNFIKAGNH